MKVFPEKLVMHLGNGNGNALYLKKLQHKQVKKSTPLEKIHYKVAFSPTYI